jgi:hypothetical protein
MEDLGKWSALVSLPSMAKVYTGRVIEAMGAGRPVVAWKVPERPRNLALFEDGKEILLYDKEKPEMLAEHIRRVQREPGFARDISLNARLKVSRFHTVERRVEQILNWIETGEEPVYTGDDSVYTRDKPTGRPVRETETRCEPKALVERFLRHSEACRTSACPPLPTGFPKSWITNISDRLQRAQEAVLREEFQLGISIIEGIVMEYSNPEEEGVIIKRFSNEEKALPTVPEILREAVNAQEQTQGAAKVGEAWKKRGMDGEAMETGRADFASHRALAGFIRSIPRRLEVRIEKFGPAMSKWPLIGRLARMGKALIR